MRYLVASTNLVLFRIIIEPIGVYFYPVRSMTNELAHASFLQRLITRSTHDVTRPLLQRAQPLFGVA